MNWGTKLIIGMAIFIAFIVGMGVIMLNSNTDALVDVDYYEKGILYDKDYREKEQVVTDHAEPEIRVSKKTLIIQFKEPANGSIDFLRPNDKRLDRNVILRQESNHSMVLPTADFAVGRWHLVIKWTNLGKEYLYEKEIYIQ